MATRRAIIDPLEGPKLILDGQVVKMDAAFSVIPDGRVYVDKGQIVAVQPAAVQPPPGFEAVAVTHTQGTIYPGLIELHNHLAYNVLPLWDVPKKFSNRGQWARHADYQRLVTGPMQVIAATPELLASICRYVEVKCLLGGVTTSQGITLANRAGIRRQFIGIVRNVESTDDDTLPEASTRIPDVAAKDAQAFFTRLKKEKTCYLLHLSEGKDAAARKAFQALEFAPGQWALTPSICGIHAAALQAADFQVLAQHGGSMVWSPLSNLLLYGATADIAAAKAAGVPIGIGPDWAPSGSKNLLGELKVAYLWSAQNNLLSARDIVAAVTRDAAAILEWQAVIGSIEPGKRADFVVFDGTAEDPYLHLIRAKETDIGLVMINGVGRYGKPGMMQSLGTVGESLKIGGLSRGLYLSHPRADPLVEGTTLAQAKNDLSNAFASLPALARRLERAVPVSAVESLRAAGQQWRLALDEILDTGVTLRPEVPTRGDKRAPEMRPAIAVKPKLSSIVERLELDPLTVADHPEWLDALAAQRNLPDFIKSGLPSLFQ
jgi:5-methylthioadenosine/S-adenosylhomocysteine deaminase